jgi:hypothetical protein
MAILQKSRAKSRSFKSSLDSAGLALHRLIEASFGLDGR